MHNTVGLEMIETLDKYIATRSIGEIAKTIEIVAVFLVEQIIDTKVDAKYAFLPFADQANKGISLWRRSIIVGWGLILTKYVPDRCIQRVLSLTLVS